jgi:cell division initiation protein
MNSVMKVTPLDIRKKSFDKVTFGGYDKEDVNAFLQALSVAWENIAVKNDDLERRLTDALGELQRVREIENSLLNTLKNVEESNHVLREQAKREAQLTVQEAQVKANQIVEEAKSKAKIVAREANQLAYNAMTQMREELRKLDYSYRLIEKQKEKLSTQMTDFLKETLVKIQQIEEYKRTTFYEDEIKKANGFMQMNNELTKQEIQDLEKKYPSNTPSFFENSMSAQKSNATNLNGINSMNGTNGAHHSTNGNGINLEKEYDAVSFFDSL